MSDKTKIILLTFFSLILVSCINNDKKNQKVDKENYETDFVVMEQYLSGVPKKMKYIISDTTIIQYMLENGYIFKKQTFIKDTLIQEIKENKYHWNYEGLYQISYVVDKIINDTLNIYIIDDSYIWKDEYIKWKSDYFLWKNLSNLKNHSIISTHFIQDGKDILHQFDYTQNNYEQTIGIYRNNSSFDSISSIILSNFNPTEITNLIEANNYMNQELKNYDENIYQLFYDFSICSNNCFAEERLKLIGNMLIETKLTDFWSDNKIEPADFIEKLNNIFDIKEKKRI